MQQRVPLTNYRAFSFQFKARLSRITSAWLAAPSLATALVLTATFALPLSGCTTASERLEKRLKPGEPLVRVFFGKYDEVETALKQAMLKYPQRVDNTEAGIFETDYVKGDARFRRPDRPDQVFSSGYRYRILIRLVKGKTDARPSVKVVVLKQIEIARDFFAQSENVQSDGQEESVILYRIGRELQIARALQKATDKAAGRPPAPEN